MMQYIPSPVSSDTVAGDPSMVVVPSFANFDSAYTFSTPFDGSDQLYNSSLLLSIEAGHQSSLRIDGRPLRNVTWKPVSGRVPMVRTVAYSYL